MDSIQRCSLCGMGYLGAHACTGPTKVEPLPDWLRGVSFNNGKTLRDEFAMAWTPQSEREMEYDNDELSAYEAALRRAALAYTYADAMLAARTTATETQS